MSANTPIHPSDRKAVFVGDGVLAAFSVPWPIQRRDDVVATVDGEDAAIQSVRPEPDYGALVTLASPPIAGARVEIFGDAPISRVTSAAQGGRIAATTLDLEFDRLTIYAQEIARRLRNEIAALRAEMVDGLSRTLRTPEPIPELPSWRDRAGRVLTFDAAGRPRLVDFYAVNPFLPFCDAPRWTSDAPICPALVWTPDAAICAPQHVMIGGVCS